VLRLDNDGNLAYRLLVAGAVIAWLYAAAPLAQVILGRFDGVLAEGVIGNAHVVGPLAGQGVAGVYRVSSGLRRIACHRRRVACTRRSIARSRHPVVCTTCSIACTCRTAPCACSSVA
jgi:hypothetical protein